MESRKSLDAHKRRTKVAMNRQSSVESLKGDSNVPRGSSPKTRTDLSPIFSARETAESPDGFESLDDVPRSEARSRSRSMVDLEAAFSRPEPGDTADGFGLDHAIPRSSSKSVVAVKEASRLSLADLEEGRREFVEDDPRARAASCLSRATFDSSPSKLENLERDLEEGGARSSNRESEFLDDEDQRNCIWGIIGCCFCGFWGCLVCCFRSAYCPTDLEEEMDEEGEKKPRSRCCFCCCYCCSHKCFWLTLLLAWFIADLSVEIVTEFLAVDWDDLAITHDDFTSLPPDVFLHTAFAAAAYETKPCEEPFFGKIRGFTRIPGQWERDYSIFEKDDNSETYIVGVRGTSEGCDLAPDFCIAFQNGPRERVKTVECSVKLWFHEMRRMKGSAWNPKISVTGHSLGGTVAMLVFDMFQKDPDMKKHLTKSYSFNPGVSWAASDGCNDTIMDRIVRDPHQIICMVDDDFVCDSLQLVLSGFNPTIDVQGKRIESLHVINGLAFHRRWSRFSYVVDLPIRTIQWTVNWIRGEGNLLPDRVELHTLPAFFTPKGNRECETNAQLERYLRFEKELTSGEFPAFLKFDHPDYAGVGISKVQRRIIYELTDTYPSKSAGLLEQVMPETAKKIGMDDKGVSKIQDDSWKEYAREKIGELCHKIQKEYVKERKVGKSLSVLKKLRKSTKSSDTSGKSSIQPEGKDGSEPKGEKSMS